MSTTPSFWRMTGLVVRPVITGRHFWISFSLLESRKWPVTSVLTSDLFAMELFYHIFQRINNAVMQNYMESFNSGGSVRFRINRNDETNVRHFFHCSPVKAGKANNLGFSFFG